MAPVAAPVGSCPRRVAGARARGRAYGQRGGHPGGGRMPCGLPSPVDLARVTPVTQRRPAWRAVPGTAPSLDAAFEGIRDELEEPHAFSAEVESAAQAAVRSPRLPDRDQLDVPFFTLDPPGSMDLDQAMHLERADGGYRVRYAIADLTAFVEPGGPLDAEARRRGQTLY